MGRIKRGPFDRPVPSNEIADTTANAPPDAPTDAPTNASTQPEPATSSSRPSFAERRTAWLRTARPFQRPPQPKNYVRLECYACKRGWRELIAQYGNDRQKRWADGFSQKNLDDVIYEITRLHPCPERERRAEQRKVKRTVEKMQAEDSAEDFLAGQPFGLYDESGGSHTSSTADRNEENNNEGETGHQQANSREDNGLHVDDGMIDTDDRDGTGEGGDEGGDVYQGEVPNENDIIDSIEFEEEGDTKIEGNVGGESGVDKTGEVAETDASEEEELA